MRGPLGPAGAQHGLALPVSPSPERKQVLLRLDPVVYEALARWASDELRSANAQIEFLLRRALGDAGRLPGGVAPIPKRGRPPKPDGPPERPADPGERPADPGNRPTD
ncbi:hypothetical protein ACFVIM_22110 [Streptomyces sp. NPDC057638]|uniref:hypothetical protein n=1 Tax=Streptomyces sp. NPDC057638 TaxID=3346190 RepID=UPI00368D938D